ncbi:MAG: terminase small subunit [bacterium]|nr:terminase small subunit [bacterium]
MFFEFDIDELKAVHPLPDGLVDQIVNRDELASGLDKSHVMIDRYRKGGMPVLSEGGNGRSYEFQLHDCWAWYHGMNAHRTAQKDETQQQMDLLRRALLGTDYDEDMLRLTPKQQAEEYEAQRRYAESALVQGTLVRVSEQVLLLTTVFGILRQQLLGLPDIMERQVGLTPDQAATMDMVAKDTLASIHDKLKNSNLAMLREDPQPAKNNA